MKRSLPSLVGNSIKSVKSSSSKDTNKLTQSEDFIKQIQTQRLSTAKSVQDFDFKKKRVRILSNVEVIKSDSKGILYWMSRDCRVQDNWAMIFAQKLALKNDIPLHVCFCLVPRFLDATIRHFKFMLNGLKEVEKECNELNIEFHLLLGLAKDRIPEFVGKHNIGGVVCDLSPLRVPMQWVEDVKSNLSPDVAFSQVDAHNIVPVWVASDKQEYAARTIRNKINSKLDVFLTEFPPVVRHPVTAKEHSPLVDWPSAVGSLECDQTVDEVDWATPGYAAACEVLHSFCELRLKAFDDKRNDPTVDCLSNLSPWFHFGQISVQRCVLVVSSYKTQYKNSVAAFCEEAIVRRELADNFCFYNPNYDNLQGLSSWALQTLNEHRKDKRSPMYSLEDLENSKTYDDLWNSAQIQLVKEGKIHGFLRMYWAKKILEWTETPDLALKNAIYLNDKYSLDGRDPNGYVGCMWSIGGIHDQGWKERAIFGKIRYMNYQGCKRKFNVSAFVARYGGKVYTIKA